MINATFYHFSKSDIKPRHLPTKREWEFVYKNFRNLQSTENNNKRKILQKIINTHSIIDNETVKNQIEEDKKQKIISGKIGNYFNSPDALIIFHCRDDEMVDDCLPQRIDMFNDILNKKRRAQ